MHKSTVNYRFARRLALRWAYGRFEYHRDGVGCLNIRDKYLGEGVWNQQSTLFPSSWGGWQPPQVEGVRFNFHLSNPISAKYGLFS